MSLRKLLLNGLSPKLMRTNYPIDQIQVKGTGSFDYSGNITNDTTNKDGIRIRTIDNTIDVITMDERQRYLVQKELEVLKNKAYFATFGGLTGTGVTCAALYTVAGGFITFGIGGALSLVSVFMFSRALEASKEYKQWNDPINIICNTRRTNLDFNAIQEKGWFSDYFSELEKKNKYHITAIQLKNEFNEKSLRDPTEFANWIDSFIKQKNLFQRNSVIHGFSNQLIIFDPTDLEHHWDSKAFHELSIASDKLNQKYAILQNEKDQKLLAIKNEKKATQETINTMATFTTNMLDSTLESSLSPYVREKDIQLSQLDRNKNHLGLGEYNKQRQDIIDAFENNPDVKRIKAASKKNKKVAENVKISAQNLWSANQKKQKENVKSVYTNRTINQFSQPIAELFDAYENSRIKNTNRM